MSNIGNNRIDVFLREYTPIDTMENNYYLSFYYNGVSFAELYKEGNKETREFANYFKWVYLSENPYADKHTFTDSHGKSSTKRNYTSVISSIKGIEEIEDAIDNLIKAAVNSGVESDLTFHIDGIGYGVVRNTDNKYYFPSDMLKVSKKGYNKKVLEVLREDIKDIRKYHEKRNAKFQKNKKMISIN